MAARDKAVTKQYYVVVDEYKNVPDEITGALKLAVKTPLYRDQHMYINRPARVVEGLPTPPECKILLPDANGVYVIDFTTDPDAAAAQAVMENVRRNVASVVGPYDDMQAAQRAKQDLRKKTPLEEATHLRVAVDSKDAEIEALKAEIAKLKK